MAANPYLAPAGSATWDPATTPKILPHQYSAPDAAPDSSYRYWKFVAPDDGIISFDIYLSTNADGYAGHASGNINLIDVAKNVLIASVLESYQSGGGVREVFRVTSGLTYELRVQVYGTYDNATGKRHPPMLVVRSSDFIPASEFLPASSSDPVTKSFTPDFGGKTHALPAGDYPYGSETVYAYVDQPYPFGTVCSTSGDYPFSAATAAEVGSAMSNCAWSLAKRVYRQPLADYYYSDAGYDPWTGTCPAPFNSKMYGNSDKVGYGRQWFYGNGQYRENTYSSATHQALSLRSIETYLGSQLHIDPATQTPPEGMFVLDSEQVAPLQRVEVAVDVDPSPPAADIYYHTTQAGTVTVRWYVGPVPVNQTYSWGPTRQTAMPMNNGSTFDPTGKQVLADVSSSPSPWIELANLADLYAWEKNQCSGYSGVLFTGVPVAYLSDTSPADLPTAPTKPWKPNQYWDSTTTPIDGYDNYRHQHCAIRATVIPPVNQFASVPELWDPASIDLSLKEIRRSFV